MLLHNEKTYQDKIKLPTKLLLIISLLLFILSFIAGLEYYPELHKIMVHLFFVFGLFIVLRQVLLLYSNWKYTKNSVLLDEKYKEYHPFISIVIPAFNEEQVIKSAILSLMGQNYPNFEIIFIDDGSTDKTVEIVRDIKATHAVSKLLIITQTNGGKASALNTGLMHAQGEFVACVDSDSVLSINALERGVKHFKDHSVGAVAGHVEVANKNHLLTQLQSLEYLLSQNFVRRALSYFGLVTIIPGPIGLFRRKAIADIGGYNENKKLFAEDADLSVRLLANGWRIVSEDEMIASTEAPTHIYDLLRQRYRWKRGIYQALHLNFGALIVNKSQRASFTILFLITESFLIEIMSFSITLFILASFFRFTEVQFLISWVVLLIFLDFLALLMATGKQAWKYFPLLLFQKVTYAYALQFWGVLALFEEWLSTKMNWDKVDRMGTLTK
ncbi:MAG: glycosyltransferase [Cocleimonas sp.]|nr:glycosyltransferase [Cocleimonas sp.]